MSAPLAERVVEVIADLGQNAAPRYRYGSGCIVRGRTVLTAAHVVAGAQAVSVRRPDKVLRAARVDWEFVGSPGCDLALVDIGDDAIDLPPIELAVVDRDSPTAAPVEDCHAVGYPQFAERPSPSTVRDTVDAWGHIPVLSNLAAGLLTVQVTTSPRPLPPQALALGESEWKGMSGAPVVANGCLLGVVSEHAPREGSSAITAVPLSALERDPAHPGWGPGVVNARLWWARLGVPGLHELRRLPAATVRAEPARPVLVGWPPSRADAFQPRRELRGLLEEMLATGRNGVARLVLSGDGGTGKTQLAAAFFDDVHRGGADPALWVPATARADVLGSYAQAYAAIHPGAGSGDADQNAHAFLKWLADAGRPWIVVLDDVADPGELSGLWPTGSAGWIVITTRLRDAAMAARGVVADVEVFSSDESLDYLTAKLAAARLPPGALAQARELAADLGYLPLALAQAAAVIFNDGSTCAGYRDLLADRSRTLADPYLFPADPRASGDEYGQTLASTWSLAADRADARDPAGLARPLLMVAAVLDPNGVPEAVFTSRAVRGYQDRHRLVAGNSAASRAVEVPDARRALRNLHQLSLVTHDLADPVSSVRMHALAQRSATESLDQDQLAATVRAAADAVVEVWPEVESGSGLGPVLRASAATLARRVPEALWQSAAHPVIFRAGRSLGEAGLVADAIAHFRSAVDRAARHLGPDERDTLRARYEVGYWRGESGDFPGAADSQRELLADQLRVLGHDDPDTLATRANLAFWWGHAGHYAEAAADTKAVIADMTRVLGRNDKGTLSARHNLADWQGKAGDPAGAVTAYTDLLTDSLGVLGPDHPDTLDTRRNLACWRGQAGAAAEAAAALREVVEDYSRMLGPDHPDTMHARDDLADWRGQAGDPAGAAGSYAELLDDRLRVLGPDHPHTLMNRLNLAEWRGHAGDPAAAAAADTELLADQTRILGAEHPHTLTTRYYLASWQGEAYGAAAALYTLEPLVADQRRILGPPHPDTLATRHNLAYWRGEAGDAPAAVAELRQLLDDQMPVLGPDHPSTLGVRHNLAYWQAKAGDTGRAAAGFRELLDDEFRVLGPDHPDTLETRQELAALRGESGDVTGAIADFRQLLVDQERVLRPGHQRILATRAHLAELSGR